MRSRLLLVLIMYSSTLLAQNFQSNPEVSRQIPQVDIPIQYDSDLLNGQRLSDFSLIVCPYKSDTIFIEELREMYPKQNLPSQILVNPPKWIKQHDEISAWVGMTDADSESKYFVILIGDYLGREVSYYIDENLDLDFSENKIETLHYRDKGKNVKISISKDEFFTLELKNNFREEVIDMTGATSLFYGDTRHIKNEFYLEFNVGVGPGDHIYRYLNLKTGFPSWYDVDFVARGIGAGIGYDLSFFGIGLNARYQNMGYYTSYTNSRKGEPVEVRTGERSTVIRDNVQVDRNLDIHPNHLLEFSLIGRINVNLSRIVRIQPTAEIGILHYLPNHYTPDRRIPETTYSLAGTRFVEVGARAEFAVGEGQSFYVGFAYNNTSWDPEGFVESLNQSDFESSYSIRKFVVGYRMALEKRSYEW